MGIAARANLNLRPWELLAQSRVRASNQPYSRFLCSPAAQGSRVFEKTNVAFFLAELQEKACASQAMTAFWILACHRTWRSDRNLRVMPFEIYEKTSKNL